MYQRPLIERGTFPRTIDYDRDAFSLNDLQTIGNAFTERYQIDALFDDLTPSQLKELFTHFIREGVLMDTEMWKLFTEGPFVGGPYVDKLRIENCKVYFRLTSVSDDATRLDGTVKVFFQTGAWLSFASQKEVTLVLNEKVHRWEAVFDAAPSPMAVFEEPDIFIHALLRPAMGYNMYRMF